LTRKYILGLLAIIFFLPTQTSAQGDTAVPYLTFTTADSYLVVEVLDDDLIHFEAGQGTPPAAGAPLATSPMVQKTDYPGPTSFTDDGQGTLTTAELQVQVDPQTLCSTVLDLSHEEALVLTAVCPQDLDARKSSLVIDPAATQHVYGLGEQFRTPGEPNGDWVGSEREPGLFGNVMEEFSGGMVGNAQFPILYALGAGRDNYALFVDAVYKQEWEFIGDEWSMTTSADPLRWYLLGGPDLPDLRADYLELSGRPLVPPKALFGLWVSEYGYDNWAELDDKRQSLNENQFPQDGFVLDLQWFGNIRPPSQMGSLSWDLANFPDPAAKIAELREDGLGLILIEESYVDDDLQNFGLMASQSYLVKACDTCGPATMREWWGNGGMVDWTNEAGAAFWHDRVRQPLIEAGVFGHWTDLGEPEMVAPNSWYAGLPGLELHDQLANNNIYNLLWAKSIFLGYERSGVTQRPVILSRSGTTGIQRYGAAMWSADIGSNFDSLAAQMNAQMHMSFSGLDYFGTDVGGFHRGNISEADLNELYTVWLANSALLDVPLRPHTENLCNCKETAPDRVGDLASNLANVRLRYALSPYYYSLAHLASQTGAPVVPPLVFYYQDDLETRELGDHKLLGRDILVRTVTEPGVTAVPVYLPAGQWVNFHTGEWISSSGQWLEDVPTTNDGLFQLPLFVRTGAIVPQMFVDEQTMNLYGLRRDGSTRDELIVYVVPAPEPTSFTLFEDDGRSPAYQSGALQTTPLSQHWLDGQITVDIAAAEGSYDGAPTSRDNVLKLAVGDEIVTAVSLNGTALPELASMAAWETAVSGYVIAAGELWAKSGPLPVAQPKQFVVTLDQPVEKVEEVAVESTAVPTQPPATPEATASQPAPNRTPLYIGLALVLVLLVGGWFYTQRRSQG
jgi:alpha-glucosidase (family GH31 glycosyl hydrolase)